jgi:hypothetical protein
MQIRQIFTEGAINGKMVEWIYNKWFNHPLRKCAWKTKEKTAIIIIIMQVFNYA